MSCMYDAEEVNHFRKIATSQRKIPKIMALNGFLEFFQREKVNFVPLNKPYLE